MTERGLNQTGLFAAALAVALVLPAACGSDDDEGNECRCPGGSGGKSGSGASGGTSSGGSSTGGTSTGGTSTGGTSTGGTSTGGTSSGGTAGAADASNDGSAGTAADP